ncbi:unnamed protein product, partial [Rotaria magnacalcarata]
MVERLAQQRYRQAIGSETLKLLDQFIQ